MANGSTPLRRSAVGSTASRSLRDVQPARTSTEGHDRASHLNYNIKQDIQRCTGKQVKAFVYMAVYEDGDVMTHATDNVQQCTDNIFASNAKECLRTSLLQARSDREMHESKTVPRADLRDIVPARTCRNGNLVNTRIPFMDDESYHSSRPASARSFGSTSGWPSDADSPAPLRGLTPADIRIVSLSHTASPTRMGSLLICESSKVKDFLARALQTMQQLAVKRIAKAWIKGICPRKQAVFPYNKKNKAKKWKEEGIFVPANKPGWWPDEKLCVFVEPDHIKREERIALCLHLLRLRPTPAQLKAWNKDCIPPHPTHVNKGWTEFLMEIAPPKIFAEARVPDEKTEDRQRLLAQAYDLAQREERYLDGEIDGTDRFCWDDDSLSRTSAKRKIRRSFDASLDDSDMESLADSAPPSKRSKQASVATTPAGSPPVILPRETKCDDHMQDCKPSALIEPFSNHATATETYPRSVSASSQRTWTHDAKDPNLTMPVHEQIQVTQTSLNYSQPHPVSPSWVETSMPRTIDLSGQSMPQGAFAVEAPLSTYPGCHNYQFPQQNLEHAPAAFKSASPYVTTQVSHPQLETLPVSMDCTSPVMSLPTYINYDHYDNSVGYYGQSDNARSQLFGVPGAPAVNTQFGYSVPPNSPFSHSNASQQPCYAVNPVTSYRYHQETGPPSYPLSEPRHGSAFQAPARVERGFTGHASGVGGGAHT